MARRKTNKNHLHRYQRFTLKDSGKDIFRCVLPGCRHYLFEQFALGQHSECNRCAREFVLNRENMELRKPHCIDCTKGRKGTKKPRTADILESLDDLLSGLR